MKKLLKVIKCIQLAITKNTKEKLKKRDCMDILDTYKELYNVLYENTLKEIDSFDEAACLLMSMIQNNITDDRKINCEIAVDACIEMIKKPIIQTKDKVYELEKVDFTDITTERQILIDGIFENKTFPSIETLSNYLKQMYKSAIGNRRVNIKTYYKKTSTPQTE